ncbi:Hypothetical protein NGAL_HAMBI2605_62880 [Neorhizobium galegae bv. orientalis]|nr:Hypothetical protein NGAL_HAMBI2605_62880 [Neorhizobium galegae bv. orientalis]
MFDLWRAKLDPRPPQLHEVGKRVKIFSALMEPEVSKVATSEPSVSIPLHGLLKNKFLVLFQGAKGGHNYELQRKSFAQEGRILPSGNVGNQKALEVTVARY